MTKNGRLISLSGIDGSGKSTQVAFIKKYFKEKSKSILVTEEMFGYFTVKPIIKYLRSATNSPSGGPVARNKKVLPKMWCIVAFFDIWIAYIFSIRKKLKKYDYIVADRYYTDIWANLLYYGYLPQWAFAPFIKLLPRPDIALIMKVKPLSVLSREDDFTADYYEDQAKIYSHLNDIFLHNPMTKDMTFTIDANKKPKIVFKQIKNILDEN